MRRFSRLLAGAAISIGLTAVAGSVLHAAPSDARELNFAELRDLVDRTQTDLRTAFDLAHGNKQNDRYHKAQDHLSKLDRSLSHGKYNKGAMNDSIDQVKSILDHNTLQAHWRDALIRDLTDLKIARDRH